MQAVGTCSQSFGLLHTVYTNFKPPASADFLAQSGFHFRFQLLRINEDDAKFEIMLDVHSYRPDEIKVKRKILKSSKDKWERENRSINRRTNACGSV